MVVVSGALALALPCITPLNAVPTSATATATTAPLTTLTVVVLAVLDAHGMLLLLLLVSLLTFALLLRLQQRGELARSAFGLELVEARAAVAAAVTAVAVSALGHANWREIAWAGAEGPQKMKVQR